MPSIDIDGQAADYYPARRVRMLVGAILSGWIFMMFSSAHQAYFDRLYRSAYQVAISRLFPPHYGLGDYPSNAEILAATGRLPG